MVWLLLYALVISLYDLRTRRIPNWASLPLLAAGLIARFPGDPALWLASLVVAIAWSKQWMGGGDAKLWLAILWALPAELSAYSPPLMFATFFLTGPLQMISRLIRKQSPTGSLAPAAWRTIPFLLACWYAH
jgi:Flp pilus assembly protein protease CpaA